MSRRGYSENWFGGSSPAIVTSNTGLIVDKNRQRISLMSIVPGIVLGMIGESWGSSGLMVNEVIGARRVWDQGCQGDI